MKVSRVLFPDWLWIALMFVMTLGGTVRAADLVDNWSFLEPGVQPKTWNFAPAGFPIFISGLKAGGVVDATSTPVNPFSAGSRALYVEPAPPNGALRIFTRPFPDKTPSQGFYEFTFRLIDDGFGFSSQVFSDAWDPSGTWYHSKTESLFGVSFTPGKPFFCGSPKRTLVTASVKSLATEENYTFRVEWQTSGDTLEFRLLLNGEPLTDANGAVVSFPVPLNQLENGVLGFRLASGSADAAHFTGFLGSIQSGTTAP